MKSSKSGLKRRDFIKTGAGAGLYIGTGTYGSLLASGGSSDRPVRIGFVGVGSRGTGMLKVALTLESVESATCFTGCLRAILRVGGV